MKLSIRKRRQISVTLLLMIPLFLLLNGCSTHTGVTIKSKNSTTLVVDNENLLPKGVLDYRITSGDQLRIDVQARRSIETPLKLDVGNSIAIRYNFVGDDYHIMAGDELQVNYIVDHELDFSALTRLDGKITIPKIGEVVAKGKTLKQLADDIAKACQAKIKNPRVTVSLLKANTAIIEEVSGDYIILPDGKISLPILGQFSASGKSLADLETELSDAARKTFGNKYMVSIIPKDDFLKNSSLLSKTVTVESTGDIHLPELGEVKVSGKSLFQTREELSLAFKARYSNPVDVGLLLVSSGNRSIYVNGQVTRPGNYPLSHNLTTLKAIALAGGITPEGDMSEVVLIHHEETGGVSIYKTNLHEVIDSAKFNQDLLLSPQDIIFVPMSNIAQANKFIDQYLNKMLPFQKGIYYNYNQNPDLSQR